MDPGNLNVFFRSFSLLRRLKSGENEGSLGKNRLKSNCFSVFYCHLLIKSLEKVSTTPIFETTTCSLLIGSHHSNAYSIQIAKIFLILR